MAEALVLILIVGFAGILTGAATHDDRRLMRQNRASEQAFWIRVDPDFAGEMMAANALPVFTSPIDVWEIDRDGPPIADRQALGWPRHYIYM